MSTGKKMIIARRVTLGLVFVAVIAALAFDTGFGTPSALGVGEFFLLCPLGGVEAMLASKTFLPAAAISLVVVLAFSLIFGRVWCAWGCPAPSIRKFFKREPIKDFAAEDAASDKAREQRRSCSAHRAEAGKASATQSSDDVATAHSTAAHSSCAGKQQLKVSLKETLSYYAKDKRVWILLGVLIITFTIGLPLFCLICPIGLTFGTVSSLWHLIVEKQITASVVVFPLCLAVELVLYRTWCLNLCPIGGLLGIVGHFAKLFRPRINTSSCLRYTNSSSECNTCAHVCPENINLHSLEAPQTLAQCTRCGECLDKCPTQSISIKVRYHYIPFDSAQIELHK